MFFDILIICWGQALLQISQPLQRSRSMLTFGIHTFLPAIKLFEKKRTLKIRVLIIILYHIIFS